MKNKKGVTDNPGQNNSPDELAKAASLVIAGFIISIIIMVVLIIAYYFKPELFESL